MILDADDQMLVQDIANARFMMAQFARQGDAPNLRRATREFHEKQEALTNRCLRAAQLPEILRQAVEITDSATAFPPMGNFVSGGGDYYA